MRRPFVRTEGRRAPAGRADKTVMRSSCTGSYEVTSPVRHVHRDAAGTAHESSTGQPKRRSVFSGRTARRRHPSILTVSFHPAPRSPIVVSAPVVKYGAPSDSPGWRGSRRWCHRVADRARERSWIRHRTSTARARSYPPCNAARRDGGAGVRAHVRSLFTRFPFGKEIAEQGVFQDWVAGARIRIEQVRLLS